MSKNGRPFGQRLRAAPMTQELTITGWLPPNVANGSHGHWTTARDIHAAGVRWAFISAKEAGWQPVKGKARLEIVLIVPTNVRMDTDNLYARCKGLVDGIKKGGWIEDDDTRHLELTVSKEYRYKQRGVILRLSEATL